MVIVVVVIDEATMQMEVLNSTHMRQKIYELIIEQPTFMK